MNIRLVVLVLSAAVLVAASISLAMSLIGDDAEDRQLMGRYDDGAIAFDYPASWRRETYTKDSSFSSAIVFLSTTAMHEPCAVTKRGNFTETTCGWPVEELDPGGVVIEWSRDAWPVGRSFGKGPGGVTIAGRLANVGEDVPGNCEHLGGELHIHAAIARDVGGNNWFGMSACLRGPSLDELRGQVYNVLDSLEIHEDLFGADITAQ